MAAQLSFYRILLPYELVMGLDAQTTVEKISRANAQGFVFRALELAVLNPEGRPVPVGVHDCLKATQMVHDLREQVVSEGSRILDRNTSNGEGDTQLPPTSTSVRSRDIIRTVV
ncbi:hypothetical protein KIN20_035454 [Parelaphostrongylus tenuis]|uniref:Uncharacterized protein n=1 Tax=Parelaphostrongylus tenuis TaxID=148309 RepID=A0AAD5WKU5_PARTN|nr:hypothetical protein KIN20_035454 [Parelaphostrongylus tenuis]